MRELDVLLERYLDDAWPRATAAERAAFERLLELENPALADCLVGGAPPPAADLAEVIALVRADPQPDDGAPLGAALAFLVGVHGEPTVPAREQFLRRPELARFSRSVIAAALDQAAQGFGAADPALFVCDRHWPGIGCTVPTVSYRCDGVACAMLRLGGRCERFVPLAPEDWRAVVDHAELAVRVGSLLVDSPSPGDVGPLRHDAVHARMRRPAPLEDLDFLCGHFRGRGGYAQGPGHFSKEVRGTWDASRRWLTLDMAVVYPLDDGRKDVHRARVVVGARGRKALFATVFTDSGRRVEVEIARAGGAMTFPDTVPHGLEAVEAARKRLQPTSRGYAETLEILRGGRWDLHSAIELERVSARSSPSAAG